MDRWEDELARALRTRRETDARTRMIRITSALDREEDVRAVDLAPGDGRLTPTEHWKPQGVPLAPLAEVSRPTMARPVGWRARTAGVWLDRGLLAIEVVAVAGLVGAVVLSFGLLRRLQQDARPLPADQVATSAAAATRAAVARITLVAATGTPTALPTATATPAPTASPAPTADPGPTMAVVPTISPTVAPSPTSTPSATPTMAATPDSPTGVRITIPAIGVDAPMVEGDNWETLKYGIGHRTGSAWPGEVGNMVISAHNDVYGSIFKDLQALQPGDLVYASTPNGVYGYEVVGSRMVLPTEVSVVSPSSEPIMTIITCYPPHVDTHRIVVTARLVR